MRGRQSLDALALRMRKGLARVGTNAGLASVGQNGAMDDGIRSKTPRKGAVGESE